MTDEELDKARAEDALKGKPDKYSCHDPDFCVCKSQAAMMRCEYSYEEMQP